MQKKKIILASDSYAEEIQFYAFTGKKTNNTAYVCSFEASDTLGSWSAFVHSQAFWTT